ncbi:hypothetical protein BGW36DRAFT_382115 [Talaromyces proteolyticus]|uniref:Uncharacterized protein n=1 Tax=Talaromyces proteolyticus TaxID=1131652 RepID=A0AAD4PYE9_9EURO|nr:uncharacterized protein BGW36DRAFT_382115 [Talaromyces proteolyticus]KAH8695098.1 hypothetical protein BGW36DRAFT_382115 [Talaromyces proteolyticus]
MPFFNSRSPASANPLSLLVSLALLFLPLTYAASCASVLLTTVATRWDSLGSAYQTEICARGCRPVISTWEEWTHQYAFIPLIDLMAREMSLSDKFQTTFTRIGEEIAKATERECSGILPADEHLCMTGSNKLDQWNGCFKRQAAKVATSNMFTMFRLVSGEICKGDAYKYLSEDKLWKEVLPQYMKKYADTCQYSNEHKKDTIETNDHVASQLKSETQKRKDEL